MSTGDEHDRNRRRILRRLDWILVAIWSGVVLVALGGGALIAWVLTGAGLPFLRTWLTVSVLLVAVPTLVHLMPKRNRSDEGAE